MNIKTSWQGLCCILSLEGEFVHQNVMKFDEVWDNVIMGKPRVVAVECSGMSYIDSSAIGTLVKVVNRSRNDDYSVVFLDIVDPIKRILSVARLDALFEMYNSADFYKKFSQELKNE